MWKWGGGATKNTQGPKEKKNREKLEGKESNHEESGGMEYTLVRSQKMKKAPLQVSLPHTKTQKAAITQEKKSPVKPQFKAHYPFLP